MMIFYDIHDVLGNWFEKENLAYMTAGKEDIAYRKQVVNECKRMWRLIRYLPWLEEKAGSSICKLYRFWYRGNSIAFPVYDSTLMSFKGGRTLLDRIIHTSIPLSHPLCRMNCV